jgi:hypothetical protein
MLRTLTVALSQMGEEKTAPGTDSHDIEVFSIESLIH